MPQENQVRLFDRVKEITYSQGTTNLALAGAADGFSSFGRFYNHNEVVFYAITDGKRYEVGSGIYRSASYDDHDNITYNELTRMPFRSSNVDNSIVNFPPGVKEVFATYPATHSVMMGSGLPNLNVPQNQSIAVWDSANILNSFSGFTFDHAISSIGLNQPNHFYGLDLGGDGLQYSSRVRASGYYVGPTGVYFQSGNGNNANLQLSKQPYAGGTQFVHFTPNLTDDQLSGDEQTNAHLVIQVSGDVNQYILLQKQDAHTVFCGPIDDCNPSCESNYPTFRPLVINDLPMVDLSGIFVSLETLIATSGSLVNYTDTSVVSASGDLYAYASGVQNNLDIHISGYKSDFRDLEVAISGKVDTYLHTLEHENPYVTSYINRGSLSSMVANTGHWDGVTPESWAIVPFGDVEYQSSDQSWDADEYVWNTPDSGRYHIDVHLSSSYDDDATNPAEQDTKYRLVTSGNGSAIPSYANGYYIWNNALPNGAGTNTYVASNVNASHSWNVNVPSGYKIYLEYSGKLYSQSNISIHKI